MNHGEATEFTTSRGAGSRAEIVTPALGPAMRVDFANRSGHDLLVFGWILGLARRVARAEIRYGDLVLDLMKLALPVPRPDVTQQFALGDSSGDQHGFYFRVELPDDQAKTSYLRLAVAQHSGELSETVWPLSSGDDAVAAFFEEHQGTLNWLLRNLEPSAAARLRATVSPANAAPWSAAAPHAASALRLTVDVCGPLHPQLLVIVARLDIHPRHLEAATLRVGNSTVDILGQIEAAGHGAAEFRNLRHERLDEFTIWAVVALPEPLADAQAVIEIATAAGRAQSRCRVPRDPEGARGELAARLQSLDDETLFAMLDRVAIRLGRAAADPELAAWLAAVQAAAIERLPDSLADGRAGVFLHCDRALRIADEGLFLHGWFHAQDEPCQVVCRQGFQAVNLETTWVRHPRRDVTSHLAALGVAASDDDHGFACFVRLEKPAAACVLALTVGGRVHRLRVAPSPPAPPLATVRAVLTSIPSTQASLAALFDDHVGPAVQAVWSKRSRSMRPVGVTRFGDTPASPAVSVIVPLYGRHDLAEYQLALFADDADFQLLELIYFVDDPSIYDEFRVRCHGLYELYRVPFTLAFAGANHGFAGANNRAAQIAGGRHLLLLNSDVLPKRSGWVSEMLSVYAALEKPGLLGVKLLYEDGSVQHAGMAFRRHPPWDDWWINDHPHKGQSAAGLTGLKRADAVTGACALVSTDLYRELGGLSEDFIIGDFEDSDFCLRAAAAGRNNWVSLDIALYHLERQSLGRIGDAQWRAHLTRFNCWQHQRRWGARIEKLPR